MQNRINISYPRYLIANEEGGILVFVAVSLAVLLGMVALSFDVGRMAATQSELQAYSDHVALAAAGELDGNPDAIIRARLAAANMIIDSQTFGDGGKTLAGETDYTLVFLNNLPADDLADVSGFVTIDPAEAIYAYVTSVPQTVFLPFARALSALTGNPNVSGEVGASAIAGFTQYACDITPLMFCLPNGNYGDVPSDVIGDSVLLRSGGQGSGWGPGDFGFLDPSSAGIDPLGPCANLNGAKLYTCLIGATDNISSCFSQRGVTIAPGQRVGLTNTIFNTRFDMFPGSLRSLKDDIQYAPGPHVVSGWKRGLDGCTKSNPDESGAEAFPEDDCLLPGGSCSRFGNGKWGAGRTKYVTANYGVDNDPFAANLSISTRYEYYLAEIEAAGGVNASDPILENPDDNGRPSCASERNPNPERRVFIAAGIDCDINPISGAATGIPVKKYFKIFLLNPVGESTSTTTPKSFDMWIEIVDVVGGEGGGTGGEGGVFRDVVMLYR